MAAIQIKTNKQMKVIKKKTIMNKIKMDKIPKKKKKKKKVKIMN